MSEYQYYEFQAIDRPLSEGDRETLRTISSRARITATSFTNSYEWGDLKGDPADFMKRWFDLHLYLANWRARRLMIRLPRRLVDQGLIEAMLLEVDDAELTVAGDNLILDIRRDEVESDDDDAWDDGSGRLAALAPLRADVLGGDLRVFYLIWLMAVQGGVFEPDEPEPLPGIGPMTGALKAFAEFFGIDADLVAAAAERTALAIPNAADSDAVRACLDAVTDGEKTDMLARVFDGDVHVGAELRAMVRARLALAPGDPPIVARTVGDIRARAAVIAAAREQARAQRRAAEDQRRADEAEKVRQARLLAVACRGEGVWRDVEGEIERRNSTGYDKATGLLVDLHAVAEERGAMADFERRLEAIRARHARKDTFIARLADLGLS